MKITFRVDSSIKIGLGHLMRCITLARHLQTYNSEIHFICRDLYGNSISLLEKKLFKVHILPLRHEDEEIYNTVNCFNWLGVDQNQDAIDCKRILEKVQPDWLIVDSYGIDKQWQKKLKPWYKKLMVIDDLANRQHECDILLDQTYGREEHEYKDLVLSGCKLLLGSKFALIRDEFRALREKSLEKRCVPKLEVILVCVGGTDPDNLTSQILTKLSEIDLSKSIKIKVVINSKSPYLSQIQESVVNMPYDTKVLVDVTDMAELMLESDLAIGAAGSMSWERCCLGLPTIQFIIADNQQVIARNLEKTGAVLSLKSINNLGDLFKKMTKNMKTFIEKSQKVTDGSGALTVAKSLVSR